MKKLIIVEQQLGNGVHSLLMRDENGEFVRNGSCNGNDFELEINVNRPIRSLWLSPDGTITLILAEIKVTLE